MTGATIKRDLRTGRSVWADSRGLAVLDRRPPLLGSTVASTAMLQWEIDLPLTALADKIGVPDAARAYRLSCSAVEGLKRIVEAEVRGANDPDASLYRD